MWLLVSQLKVRAGAVLLQEFTAIGSETRSPVQPWPKLGSAITIDHRRKRLTALFITCSAVLARNSSF